MVLYNYVVLSVAMTGSVVEFIKCINVLFVPSLLIQFPAAKTGAVTPQRKPGSSGGPKAAGEGGGGGGRGKEREDVTTPAAARARASLVNTSYVPEVV